MAEKSGFIVSFTLIIIIGTLTVFPGRPLAGDMDIKAKSAILLDINSGKVLYEKNPDRLIPPASLTKVLSLYLAHEAIRDGRTSPETSVIISRRAGRTGGSRMFLSAGQQVPLAELMKGMAIVSGNDASVAVAEHLEGDVPSFVRSMNSKARQLGMRNSRFKNPNGLPARGQYTTARDVLALSRAYLRDFSGSLEMHSVADFTFGQRTLRNHNRLVRRMEEVDGLKTGFIRAAGFHIVATAKRDKTRLIAVVLGAKSPGIRDRETVRLLEEGFRIAQGEILKATTQTAELEGTPASNI